MPAHRGTPLKLQLSRVHLAGICAAVNSGRIRPLAAFQFSFIIFGWPQSPREQHFPLAVMGVRFRLGLDEGQQGGVLATATTSPWELLSAPAPCRGQKSAVSCPCEHWEILEVLGDFVPALRESQS